MESRHLPRPSAAAGRFDLVQELNLDGQCMAPTLRISPRRTGRCPARHRPDADVEDRLRRCSTPPSGAFADRHVRRLHRQQTWRSGRDSPSRLWRVSTRGSGSAVGSRRHERRRASALRPSDPGDAGRGRVPDAAVPSLISDFARELDRMRPPPHPVGPERARARSRARGPPAQAPA